MTTEVLWRLMALWEGNERDGAAFAEAACACLDTLQPGAARTGRSARKEEMCWATPRNLLWIFVEELAIEGELTCDLLKVSRSGSPGRTCHYSPESAECSGTD